MLTSLKLVGHQMVQFKLRGLPRLKNATVYTVCTYTFDARDCPLLEVLQLEMGFSSGSSVTVVAPKLKSITGIRGCKQLSIECESIEEIDMSFNISIQSLTLKCKVLVKPEHQLHHY